MSNNKQINTRIQHKHDIESNWIKALNFIPKAGEIIVYDADENYNYARIKIGDGLTSVNELKFSDSGVGENVEGVIYTINETDVTAGAGAEIFNDYINNKATGPHSHAEGSQTTSSGHSSHAEGFNTTASGPNSHTEGQNTIASGPASHAEGFGTKASDVGSHAEGNNTTASAVFSHAEGISTTASGMFSHAEGANTKASGIQSHAEGNYTEASGTASHAEGQSTHATAMFAHAEGCATNASGANSHAEGSNTTAKADTSHAEGAGTVALGYYSHVEGYNTTAYGKASHAEGHGNYININITGSENSTTYTLSDTNSSIQAGVIITYDGVYAKIIEYNSDTKIITVDKTLSAESLSNAGAAVYDLSASGDYSHAEGRNIIASGDYSHAEGWNTTASGRVSHTEGESTTASGYSSHAEGYRTKANGNSSHAEGLCTIAEGACSHAEGYYTIAEGEDSHVQGKFNIGGGDTLAHIIGNGANIGSRSNAHTIDWDGNAWFAGDVYVGSTSGVNKDEGSRKLVTADEMNAAIEDGIASNAQTDEEALGIMMELGMFTPMADGQTILTDEKNNILVI